MSLDQMLVNWNVKTKLINESGFDVYFEEIIKKNSYLKIILRDSQDNLLEVIYDDPHNITPFEYVVWSFKHTTEMVMVFGPHDLMDIKRNIANENYNFFKVIHSDYIAKFDNNHLGNRTLYPNVEHHVYITGDEVLEVISNYEPKFIEK